MSLRPILLVDDNRQDIELALDALEQFRPSNPIVVANDGSEALDYLFRRGGYATCTRPEPAVIFLDLKMPKVDGLEVLRQVKSHPVLKEIPVVMMTSSREEVDLTRSYELGVNAYVVKPMQFQESIELLQRLGEFWLKLNELPAHSAA